MRTNLQVGVVIEVGVAANQPHILDPSLPSPSANKCWHMHHLKLQSKCIILKLQSKCIILKLQSKCII